MTSLLDRPAIRRQAMSVSVEQYHRLAETGIISQNTELLQGVIVHKMGKSPLHTWLVRWLHDLIAAGIPAGFHVRKEEPLTTTDSEPEPDIAVVDGRPEDYRLSHPNTARLAVEVAVTSEELDREKAVVYAAADVDEYWLVLPQNRCVEVFSQPSENGYGQCRVFGENDILTSACLPGLKINLSDGFTPST